MPGTTGILPVTPEQHWQLQALAAEGAEERFLLLRRYLDAVDPPSPNGVWLAVWRAGRPIAFGGLTADPWVHQPSVGRIRNVYVQRESRRAGIGSDLVRALERSAPPFVTTIRIRAASRAVEGLFNSLAYERVSDDWTATHQSTLGMRDPLREPFSIEHHVSELLDRDPM